MVLTSSSSSTTISLLHQPPKKNKKSLSVGLLVCQLNYPLGCLKLLIGFPLSVFDYCLHCPASLPDYHENCLIEVDSSLGVTLGFLGFHWLSLATAHPVHLPRLTARKPFNLSGLKLGSPPLFCFWPLLMLSSLLA